MLEDCFSVLLLNTMDCDILKLDLTDTVYITTKSV